MIKLHKLKNRRPVRPRSGSRIVRCGALLMLSAATGCARLTIGVDAYMGELLMPDDAKLAKGVAFAGQVNALVIRDEAQLSSNFPWVWDRKHTADYTNYFNQIGTVYAKEEIEAKWQSYVLAEAKCAAIPPTATSLNHSGGSVSSSSNDLSASLIGDRNGKRQSLESSLLRYGNACILAGQELGLVPALQARFVTDMLLLVPGLDYLALRAQLDNPQAQIGVALEESGRRLVDLASDVEDTSQRATLSHLMQASAQGDVLNLATSGLASKMAGISGVLGEGNWSRVNNILVDGTGKEEYVIIKDDVGNWHIKSATSDPSDVANAVFDTTAAMVNVVASHYGVPVSLGSTDSSNNASSGTYSSGEVKSDEAQQVLQQLTAARKALQTALADAVSTAAKSTDKDATAMTEAKLMAQQAADTYKARVNEITFDAASTTPAQTTPTSTTPAPTGSTATANANPTTPSK